MPEHIWYVCKCTWTSPMTSPCTMVFFFSPLPPSLPPPPPPFSLPWKGYLVPATNPSTTANPPSTYPEECILSPITHKEKTTSLYSRYLDSPDRPTHGRRAYVCIGVHATHMRRLIIILLQACYAQSRKVHRIHEKNEEEKEDPNVVLCLSVCLYLSGMSTVVYEAVASSTRPLGPHTQ